MKKVLMHTCCAPCSVYCIDSLRAEDIEPTIFWYNPNIHPYMEYKARRDCLRDYCKKVNIENIFIEDYGLDEFCKNVVSDIPNRCVNYCYKKRLTETVRAGVEFLYRDFRVGFREGQAKARELGLYMQKYCGCIFSEEDRYRKQIEKDLTRDI